VPFFVDSSALVKLVIAERESRALAEALAPERLVSSVVAVVEVLRASRRAGGDVAAERAARVLDRVELVGVSASVTERAASLRTHELRSLDAIQLASALEVRAVVSALVAYDERLLQAAAAAELETLSPR